MRPTTSSTWAAACSSVSRPFSTRPSTCPCVTLRASSRPAWTSSSLTSLSTTGVPEAAMVWAIWPPMVPAPTTAALNTNMAPQAALERLALRAADEEQIHEGHPGALLLERVAQLQGHGDPALERREAHA